jgi:ubiquinone/menaquinone biosynthesis C-methylase UbiE
MTHNSPTPKTQEDYTPGYGKEVIRSYQTRSVQFEAAFFYPHLQAGMNLLDCGSGPGTITMGLAEIVEPGTVIGIDVKPGQVEIAEATCRERGLSNVLFQISSVYQLPFPDSSFDGAFVHAVLQHLKDPGAALREINRVLKPGGIVGVRDDDQGGMVLAPADPKMEKVVDLLKKIIRAGGGDPFVGRRHRQLLREAGFTRVVGSASTECDGTLQSTTTRGDLAAALLDHMTETVVKSGWSTAAEVRELADACKAWGRDADAFDAIIWCEAVGWKP